MVTEVTSNQFNAAFILHESKLLLKLTSRLRKIF